ncbi:aldo/keto reductase [Microbispora sp. ATCC PTA-5024]|uniref:aldo/keto reductase n=1 Tax=Microbispora sp. ATCC PTA-5024 TaxID=316330 RepID=UPI0003DDB3E8|nr:aldo/keto reductase [Microbispora sp. ATCC PTA-5024]ETK35450.1 aldo/keto reductase [Microbispora sp. ATCC PTA-5024]
MRRVTLGSRGPEIAGLGFGCLSVAGVYGDADPDESLRVVRRALDAGVSLIDATDIHGDGEVERLVGKAVAHRREEAVIATSARQRPGSRPGDLVRCCDTALSRLGVDRIDLFYVNPAAGCASVEETMGVAGELLAAGKIRHVGVRGVTAGQLRRAHEAVPVTALAVEYSLWRREAEREHLPAARELGVGVVACRPLGRGFLTGRITTSAQLAPGDVRLRDPRFAPESLALELGRLREAQRAAADLDVGVGRLAIAWLLTQGDDVVPVPSTRDLVHLEMNLAAAGIVLSEGVRARLAETFPLGEGPLALGD